MRSLLTSRAGGAARPGWRLLPLAGALVALLLAPTPIQAQTPTWQAALAPDQLRAGTSITRATATDAAGNVYVTGQFDGQVAFGSTVLTSAGGQDMFVARYTPGTGTWAWATSGGGTSNDIGYGIATAGTQVYVTGQFVSGTSASIAGQALAGTGTGNSDVFVAAYTTAGANDWATSGGGTSTDIGRGIATDGTRVYVTGQFGSGTSASIAGQALTGAGDTDVFVAAYTTAGANAWATSGGGTGGDTGYGIATASGRVYAGLGTGGTATFGGFGPLPAGAAGLATLTTAGVWQGAVSPRVGGTSRVNGTATDAAGNVYVTGQFSGQVAFGSTVLTSAGNNDVFVARYTPGTGTWAWASSGGGTGFDQGTGIATDGTRVYVTGSFISGTGASFAGQALAGAGGNEMFVAAYTVAGANAWATSGGGSDLDYGAGIATDGTRVYVTGLFRSGTGANIAGQALAGTGTFTDDVFVAAYTTAGADAWVTSGGGTGFDFGNGIATHGSRVYAAGFATPPATFGSLTLAGTATQVAFLGVLAPPAPVLTSLNPTSGPVGASVTITGTDLSSATGVSFNGTAATIGTNTATTITVNVPVGATSGPVTVTTANGTSNGLAFTVITNQAPTALGLSPQSVAENTAAGTAIGNFSTTDPDAGDTHTYTLVPGAGDTDNGAFSINGSGQLVITAAPDFEAQPSYDIRVQSTDGGGLSFEQTFTITVNDVVEDLVITSSEAIPAGTYRNITITGTGDGFLTGDIVVTGAMVVQANGQFSSSPDTPGAPTGECYVVSGRRHSRHLLA